MKQVRVQRRPRRSSGGGEPMDAPPTQPVTDTRRVTDLIDRIDRALDAR